MEAHGELIPLGGGDPIPLARDHLILGRRESCNIPLAFPKVSSNHCELFFQDGYWFIRDLGSTNGTKVNGKKIPAEASRRVLSGDRIVIARHGYVIQYDHDPGEAPGLLELL